METFITWGKKIYNTQNASERRRFLVFLIRSLLHRKKMQQLLTFFSETVIKKDILKAIPFFVEQATRQFFYKNSTVQERVALIEEHVDFLTTKFSTEAIKKLYITQEGIDLWETEYEGGRLFLQLQFAIGQRKEGNMLIALKLDDVFLYQMMVWIAKSPVADEKALYIGAMQGPSVDHGNELIKGLTKRFFGYRTKNLILYATRAFARALKLSKIYAVTNEGYYANNHVRVDRKLKTSFNDFWAETGGFPCRDTRFYDLPLTEHRKSIEEIKTHKRSQYRKRFAVLDEIDQSVDLAVQRLLR